MGDSKRPDLTHAVIQSPLGQFAVGATDRGICAAEFGEFEAAQLGESAQPLYGFPPAWVGAIAAYLAGRQRCLDLPLDIQATAFRMAVWNYLRTIPYGEVRTYTEVAAGIGSPKAVRAVGHACAVNPLAVIIPCHRVVRTTGELGGYRWGLWRKRALIELERSSVSAA